MQVDQINKNFKYRYRYIYKIRFLSSSIPFRWSACLIFIITERFVWIWWIDTSLVILNEQASKYSGKTNHVTSGV